MIDDTKFTRVCQVTSYHPHVSRLQAKLVEFQIMVCGACLHIVSIYLLYLCAMSELDFTSILARLFNSARSPTRTATGIEDDNRACSDVNIGSWDG